jgi:hypothetical protein
LLPQVSTVAVMVRLVWNDFNFAINWLEICFISDRKEMIRREQRQINELLFVFFWRC